MTINLTNIPDNVLKKSKIYCIYHRVDMDGRCSGAIVRYFKDNKHTEVIEIPYNYNEPLTSIDEIEDNSLVYMVDMSLDPEDMKKLNNRTNFIWIDHHDTAIKNSEEHGYDKIKGLRVNGTAACELTWTYFTKSKERPFIVKMLGRFDVWDLSYEPKTFWVNTYLFNEDLHPTEENKDKWKQLFELEENDNNTESEGYTTNKILKIGEILYNYQLNQFAQDSKAKSFLLTYDNKYKVIAANSGAGSKYFHDILTDEHDFMLSFYITRKLEVKYSLYTEKDNIHMGEIAKILGENNGGGHPGAAGFKSNKLPWQLNGMSKITE